MCCHAKKDATKDLTAKMRKNGGKMVFWKVITNDARSQQQRSFSWFVGKHEAVAKKAVFGKFDCIAVNHGFHVYTDRKQAINNLRSYRNCENVSFLEVTCDVKHLLGAENKSVYWLHSATAVFNQVEVTKKQWSRYKKSVSDYKLRNPKCG